MTSIGVRALLDGTAKPGLMNRAFWDPRAPVVSDDESDEEENDPSSIADVFADMLNVNEDMILAAAECHADNDIEGTLAYQRILHRNLMEMANYIDSTFGVYSNSTANGAASRENANATSPAQADDGEVAEAVEAALIDRADSDVAGIASSSSGTTAVSITFGTDGDKKPSALLKTLEADEKLRVIKRSKKQWMKSRHQVREEESVSAIMNETAEKIAAIAVAAREDAFETARAAGTSDHHQMSASDGYLQVGAEFVPSAATPEPTDADSAVRIRPGPVRPPPDKIAIAAAPSAFNMAAPFSQLNGLGLLALFNADALTHVQMQAQNPGLNMFFPPLFAPPMPFAATPQQQRQPPPLMMMDSAAGMRLPWASPPLYTGDKPSAIPAPLPAKTVFSRMCADCRNSHWSLHRCRVALQHTAPEWVPSDTPTAPRKNARRSRKAKAGEAAKT